MSLETLLEAAEFLEHGSHNKTREEFSQDFHPYAKSVQINSGSDGSNDTSFSSKFIDYDGKERRRAGGAGTREVHNKLEKNRRAHLKECFDILKNQVPSMEDKKTSNLTILRGALRYIQALKRKEKEFEQDMQKWVREKIVLQERIIALKTDLSKMNVEFDLDLWTANQDQETVSTSTASENGSIYASDEDEKPVIVKPVRPTIVPTPVKPPMSSISAEAKLTNAPVVAAPMVAPIYRTPVTQILHQTITQRAALQQMQLLQKQQQQQQQLLQQQNPLALATQVTTVQANTVRPAAQVMKSISQDRPQLTLTAGGVAIQGSQQFKAQMAAINKLAAAVAIPMTTTTKTTFSPSFVVNTATGVAPITSTVPATQPMAMTAATAGTVSMTPTATAAALQVGIVGTPHVNQSLTASFMNNRLNANNIATVPTNIKQLLSTPGATAQLVSGGQLTISPLRTSTIGQMLSSGTNITNMVGLNAPLSTVQPVVSLTHLTPVTHIMSPMTVMAPTTVQVGGQTLMGGLTQQQITSMLQQQQPQLVKSLNQIPLLQHQFLQTGQVMGQQVVKPVVLVPSGVPTTTGQATGQVTMSVTRASS